MSFFDGAWFSHGSKRWMTMVWQNGTVRVCVRDTRMCQTMPALDVARAIEHELFTRSV